MFLYIGSKFQKLFVCSRNSDGALGRKKKKPHKHNGWQQRTGRMKIRCEERQQRARRRCTYICNSLDGIPIFFLKHFAKVP